MLTQRELNQIKQLIKDCHISREFIAESMGVTLITLQNKLSGKNEFKASEVNILAEILGVQILTIFYPILKAKGVPQCQNLNLT